MPQTIDRHYTAPEDRRGPKDGERSFEEIAEALGVTRQRAYQLFVSAMRKVRRQMALRGVKSTNDLLPGD